jgi:hypothetical protein
MSRTREIDQKRNASQVHLRRRRRAVAVLGGSARSTKASYFTQPLVDLIKNSKPIAGTSSTQETGCSGSARSTKSSSRALSASFSPLSRYNALSLSHVYTIIARAAQVCLSVCLSLGGNSGPPTSKRKTSPGYEPKSQTRGTTASERRGNN